MKKTLLLLGSAAMLCCAANASDWTGLLTGGYQYTDMSGVGVDIYDVSGLVAYKIPSTIFNVQGGVHYSGTSIEGVTANTWSGSGAVFLRGQVGVIGAFGDYNNLSVLGMSEDYGRYGVLGEWYATNHFTLRARGGGITANGVSGGFVGAGASYYLLQQLSLNLDAQYNSLSLIHWTTITVGGEYKPFADCPLSLGVSYVRTRYGVSHSLDGNGVLFRLTYRFGESGSLVDLDRNGPINVFSPMVMFD